MGFRKQYEIDVPDDAEALWSSLPRRGRALGNLSTALSNLPVGGILRVSGRPNNGVFQSAAKTVGVRISTRKTDDFVLVRRIA